MAKDRSEVINSWLNEMINSQSFEETDEVRLAAMQGLQAAWDEMEPPKDFDEHFEMVLYKVTLSGMIASLKLKLTLLSTVIEPMERGS